MNKKIATKLLSMLTALTLMLGVCVCPAAAEEEEGLTRGEAAQMLLTAADDYNEGVVLTDILYGYEDGELHEEYVVTRAEALVMLKRAFGELPELTGHNARVAIPAEDFTDIPEWAAEELSDVFDAGIVAGTSEGVFSPDEPVTKSQMELFIERVYSIFGTNLKDDFYAAINKETLENMTLDESVGVISVLKQVSNESSDKVSEILDEIVAGTYEYGTMEQKIADTYKNYMNIEARNSAGLEPIQKYLDMISSAESIDDLVEAQCAIDKDLAVAIFFGFDVFPDYDDSTQKILYTDQYALFLSKEMYLNGTDSQKNAYKHYLANVLEMAGVENASDAAEAIYDAEEMLAASALDSEDYYDVDKTNNKYTFDEIKAIYPNVDLDAVFAAAGYAMTDKIIVEDVGYMEAFAEFFNDDNLEILKNMATVRLLNGTGSTLCESYIDVVNTFENEFYGTEGSSDIEEIADANMMSLFSDYLSELYVERYFSAEAKADVEAMIEEIVAVYRERIQNLDWMSDATKQNAVKKLDALNVFVGYPVSWETYLDDAEIVSGEDGGSYFDNVTSIRQAYRDKTIAEQDEPVDNTEWFMSAFTANAGYDSSNNSIIIPAGILQSPYYDINASYEENMGGIGTVIAHEITHAFDNNGSKYDENGNAADWWTEEDRAAFDELCDKVVEFYDGEEGVPGVQISGELTLFENIADLGAIACVTELVSKRDNPDFEALYTSFAKVWAGTMTREYAEYCAKNDVHAQYKLRTNLVIKNVDEFYETFGITEGDGMYVAPEDRITIW